MVSKIFYFHPISPLPGEMIQFDEHIFQTGWNHQLVMYGMILQEDIMLHDWWVWKIRPYNHVPRWKYDRCRIPGAVELRGVFGRFGIIEIWPIPPSKWFRKILIGQIWRKMNEHGMLTTTMFFFMFSYIIICGGAFGLITWFIIGCSRNECLEMNSGHWILRNNDGSYPPSTLILKQKSSWEFEGTPPMPPPPRNKALLRDDYLLGPDFLGLWRWGVPLHCHEINGSMDG